MSEYIMKSTSNGWGMYVGELIRCKDCKHLVEHEWYGNLGYTCNGNMDGWVLPESYCSMAERKEK